jgi:hypothetical protein
MKRRIKTKFIAKNSKANRLLLFFNTEISTQTIETIRLV